MIEQCHPQDETKKNEKSCLCRDDPNTYQLINGACGKKIYIYIYISHLYEAIDMENGLVITSAFVGWGEGSVNN